MDVELGFRAYDPHELLPHVVATRLGLYEQVGVHVRLRDLTFDDRALPQVSCGAALLGRLRGEPLRIALVACRRPLFWVVTRHPRIPLESAHIASYPDGSPPALFARILLPAARFEPARDNDARVGLLVAGEVDGAVISSAQPWAALQRLGLHRALAFADALTVPTTGLAVPESMLPSGETAALTSALRKALAAMHEGEHVVGALVDAFRFDPSSAEHWARDNVRAFSPNGSIPRDEAAVAVALIAQAADLADPGLDAIFTAGSLSSEASSTAAL